MVNRCKIPILTLIGAFCAYGNSITFVTPSGATVTDGAVSASADFTTAANLLTISLTNTLANIKSVGQGLSDLSFSFDSSALGTALASSSGNVVDISSGGTYTNLGMATTGWGLDLSGADAGLRICLLNGCGVGPEHVIVGPPDSGTNTYSNANASIADNGPHNPFLNGTVLFQVTVPGLLATSNVTGAVFSFGTEEGSVVTGVPTGGGGPPAAIPEPGTWLLLCSGGLLIVLSRRKFIY